MLGALSFTPHGFPGHSGTMPVPAEPPAAAKLRLGRLTAGAAGRVRVSAAASRARAGEVRDAARPSREGRAHCRGVPARVRACAGTRVARARSGRPAAAARTAHPGSCSCLQFRNRHCAATSVRSPNTSSMPAPASQRPSSRVPGVSMISPPPGSSISSRRVVVCRPLPSARTSPVASASLPDSRFTSVDLPVPLGPTSTATEAFEQHLAQTADARRRTR